MADIEPLDRPLKAMLTKTMSDRVDDDTRPGRNRSDVTRDALEFYFEHRNRLLQQRPASYGAKRRQGKPKSK